MKQKVLVISHDKVGPKMAGPGIRYHQIASELAKHFDTTLATFNPAHLEGVAKAPYKHTDIKAYDFQNEFSKYDVIIAMWLGADMITYAKSKGIRLVFDLYAPVPVEDLIAKVFSGKTGVEEAYNYSVSLEHYRAILRSGDFFLCSNEIQKDFWVGFGFSAGATSPNSYEDFPLYERIQTLPMGINLDELEEKHDTSLLSKKIPSIKDSDFVIVWTGGIWDWFDAITPIDAVNELVKAGKDHIKFVFLGTRHPNKDVPDMDETSKAFNHVKKLGLYDKNVFFLEGWLDYSQRLSYLLRADLALYAHKPSIEARYSHRTRVLDHILARLPTLATKGDYLADMIEERGFGIVVPPLDKLKMAAAIDKIASEKNYAAQIRSNLQAHQNSYTWQNATKDLVSFIDLGLPARPISNLPDPNALPQGGNRLLKATKRKIPKPIKDWIKRHL